ncbi:cache domain-containing protein [Oceanibium sediminis]|uniref:cache domain-containing protein n=1 Tax=Oceanibium sediminis TaxID=2026339 RepID=UPI000DD4E04F|nr:cache domain-containing protein [Oceanibium sediminis]
MRQTAEGPKTPARTWLTYGQKLFLLATVPLVFAASAMAVLVAVQSRALAEQEIKLLEERLLEAKQSELSNYMSLARTSIGHIYGNAAPDDAQAKTRVAQILAAMTYGSDGFFFVYDYDGTNLVSPKQTYLINRNWWDVPNQDGEYVVRRLVEIARQGGGIHEYVWPKPSTGVATPMYSYVIGLQDWRWAVGTGIWIDDVIAQVASARAATEARIQRTFLWIAGITLLALLLVFVSGLWINIRERRLADTKLKALTQRIFDTQEEERSRVARELHDGISQILIGVRYGLDIAGRRLRAGKPGVAEGILSSTDGLNDAIQEVRRISRDLRPGVLDDLGLGPALKTLVDEFAARTGIHSEFDTAVFRNRLTAEAKTALYRVAQEALTNIERHANATEVKLRAWGHRSGATLRIEDNGVGMDLHRQDTRPGVGLRNMAERIEHLDGNLQIQSTAAGTVVTAQIPLKHLLRSDSSPPPARKESA